MTAASDSQEIAADAMWPVRILLLTPTFPPVAGGIERTAGSLAGGLAGAGAMVHVVAGRPTSRSGMDVPREVSLHWSANDPSGGRRATFALARLAIRVGLRFRPDVILVLHIRAMPPARALARITGARVVLVVHAKEMREQPGLARAAMAWADAIVTVSRFSSELARGAGADRGKLTMIHPGVILPVAASPALTERAGPPTIITVSRLSDPNKGHDVALEAMAILRLSHPEARWKIVGEGSLRSALEERADELGLSRCMTFTGSLNDLELADALDRAHIFCLLSRPAPAGAAGEGFGIAFIEAGARGLPVVAGRTPGVVDAVIDGRSGLLVDATDPQAVADALGRLLTDAKLCDRLGDAGRARAAELDWSRVVGRYRDVITGAIERPVISTPYRDARWLRDVLLGPS